MSKDFEQAYKELAQNEIPDLWDRIEAGLESRSTPADESIPDRLEEESMQPEKPFLMPEDSEEIKLKELPEDAVKKKRWLFYSRRYAGMAAAVLCAVIVIPAAVVLGHFTRFSLSGAGRSQMEGIDTAAAEAAPQEEAVSTDSAPDEEGTGQKMEMTAAEAAENESSGAGMEAAAVKEPENTEDAVSREMDDALEDTAGAPLEEDFGENLMTESLTKKREDSAISGTAGAEAVVEESMADMDAGQGSGDRSAGQAADTGAAETEQDKESTIKDLQEEVLQKEIPEGKVFEHVIITVEKAEEISSEQPGGTLYTVVVEKGPLELLGDGGTLKLYLPVHSSIFLSEDKTYEVDIVSQSSEKYPFAIQKYHQKIGK